MPSRRAASTLLDLPCEILSLILRNLLTAADPIDLWNLSQDWRAHIPCQRVGLHPNILRASRLLSEEGCRLLYGGNTFRITILLHPHDQNVWRHHGGTPHATEPRFHNVDWLPERHYFYTFEQYAGVRYPLGRLLLQLEPAELGRPCWGRPVMRLNTAFDDICRWLSDSKQFPRKVEVQCRVEWDPSRWYQAAGRCEDFSRAIARLMCDYSHWQLNTLCVVINSRMTRSRA
jgi:hypothetical protein